MPFTPAPSPSPPQACGGEGRGEEVSPSHPALHEPTVCPKGHNPVFGWQFIILILILILIFFMHPIIRIDNREPCELRENALLHTALLESSAFERRNLKRAAGESLRSRIHPTHFRANQLGLLKDRLRCFFLLVGRGSVIKPLDATSQRCSRNQQYDETPPVRFCVLLDGPANQQ